MAYIYIESIVNEYLNVSTTISTPIIEKYIRGQQTSESTEKELVKHYKRTLLLLTNDLTEKKKSEDKNVNGQSDDQNSPCSWNDIDNNLLKVFSLKRVDEKLIFDVAIYQTLKLELQQKLYRTIQRHLEKMTAIFNADNTVNGKTYIVTHKTFGKGVVTKITETKIEVLFETGSKLFQFPDCFSNKYLSCDDEEFRTIIDNALSTAKSDTSYIQNKFIEFNLSENELNNLNGFFKYLTQKNISGISYRFLIQTESQQRGIEFANKLAQLIEQIKNKKQKILKYSEQALLTENLSNVRTADILIVAHALPNDRYYVTDGIGSTERDIRERYDYSWTQIMQFFRGFPDIVFIMIAPKSIVQGRIKKNPDMYYRFLRHKIEIQDIDEETIFEKMMKKIKSSIPNTTINFEKAFKEYIYTVYPRADLRGYEFIDDLFEWMVSLTFAKYGHCNFFSANSIPYYHRNKSFEQIEDSLHELVGLDDVKTTIKDIGLLWQNIPQDSQTPYLHMIFKGNPGTGKTTVAHHIARMLKSMRVIKKDLVVEVMTADLLGEYVGHTAPKVERKLKEAAGGILFIDEAYLLNPAATGKGGANSYREECVGTLLKAMENKTDPVIIFAGYPKQMDDFLKCNPGLSSRIGYTLIFEDYTNDQLLQIFEKMCRNADYQYTDQTLDAVARKLTALRYEDNFGNARTVENIFNHAVIECLRAEPENRTITADHIKIKKDIRSLEDLQEQLQRMIGIRNVKTVITEQILSNRFSTEFGKPFPSSNNMIFVGNPGTGKTTTAKIFSEMLFSIGVAKSPRTKMITAKDLYVHNVSQKLNEICNETMGGVLFIDEIYLLQKDRFLCTEIVSVLLELLENKKEDLTIILAGYEKQMASFLNENSGLQSRFPITVHFDDFTEDELYQIFEMNCKAGSMMIHPSVRSRFNEIIRAEMKKPNFGNGRTVLNIYERAFRHHAVNFYNNEDWDPDCIMAEDLEDVVDSNEKQVRIGFN